MNRREVIGVALAILWASVTYATPAHAATLTISPLHYDVTLSSKEAKKGYVDITNPAQESETIKLEVQAFRQTDDSGSLEFYDQPILKAGVQLDYSEVTLGPRETLHLAFLVDSTKLPTGDVFAAILATVVPQGTGAGVQTVRVGTLLTIVNGAPGVRDIRVEQLATPFLQLGDGISTHFSLRNPTARETSSGFAPKVSIRAWPYFDDTVRGPLIFAGRSRQIDYHKMGDYVGLVKVDVTADGSQQSSYSILITGYWRWLLPLLASTGAAILIGVRHHRKKQIHTVSHKPTK